MNTRILSQIRNLLDIANNFKSNTNIYFFLKNYAFMVANSTLLKDNSGAFENEKKEITGMYREFRQEKANANWNYIVPKEEYVQFLEQFLSNIDFDNANLFILNVSKDLTEVLGVYGEFDDLWSRRSKIYHHP